MPDISTVSDNDSDNVRVVACTGAENARTDVISTILIAAIVPKSIILVNKL